MGAELNAAIQAMMEIVERETTDFLYERFPKIYPHYYRLIVLECGTPAEIQETKSSLDSRITQIVKAVLLAVFGLEPDAVSSPEIFLQRYKRVMALYQEAEPRTRLYGCLEDAPDIFREDLSQKQKGDVLTVDNRFFQDASGKVDEKFKKGVAGRCVFKKASSQAEYPHAASIFTPDGETFLTEVVNGLKGIWPIWQGADIAGFVTLDGDGDMAIRYGDGKMEYMRQRDTQVPEAIDEPAEPIVTPSHSGDFDLHVGESVEPKREINLDAFNEYTEQKIASCMNMIAHDGQFMEELMNQNAIWKKDAIEIMKDVLTHYIPMRELVCGYGSRWVEKFHDKIFYPTDYYKTQYVHKAKRGTPATMKLSCRFDKGYPEVAWTNQISRLLEELEYRTLVYYSADPQRGMLKIKEFDRYEEIDRLCALMVEVWWEYSEGEGKQYCYFQEYIEMKQKEWDAYKKELTAITSAMLEKFTLLYKAAYIGDDEERQKEYRDCEILGFNAFLQAFKRPHKQKPDFARRLSPNLNGYRNYIQNYFPAIAEEADRYLQEMGE